MTRTSLLLAAVPLAAIATVAHADDDHVSRAQRAAIVHALAQQGCRATGEIERDDGHFEAERVRCRDGWYEIHLDRRYRIIERKHEDRDDD
jgi:hypothetical protein